MLPLAFGAILAGALLVIAGVTGSTVSSTAQGTPDRSKATPPTAGTGSLLSTPAPGGTAPAATAPVNTRGLANPLPGFTIGRTDQGVDASGRAGQPVYAIAPGRVLGILSNWYRGQPFLYYEIIAGELKGKVIYVAEQIAPVVRPGQELRAGQVIGHYAASGTGLELGYATRSGQTLAQSTTGYSEGEETAAGKAFRQLLGRL
jgi:murein DD-endopeptidase MepM/ murein hydrolase activator NlpD